METKWATRCFHWHTIHTHLRMRPTLSDRRGPSITVHKEWPFITQAPIHTYLPQARLDIKKR